MGVLVCVSNCVCVCVCVLLYLCVCVCMLQNRVVSSSSGPLFAARGGMRVLLEGGGLTHLQTLFEERKLLRKVQGKVRNIPSCQFDDGKALIEDEP